MDIQARTASLTPLERAALSARALIGIVRTARGLTQSRRSVDLSGLEHEIGRLCAASLDLEPAEGRTMRPRLVILLTEIEALAASLALPREERT